MKRPLSLAAKLALAVAALLAVGAAAAGGLSSSEAPKKSATNSFNILSTGASPNAPVVVPSNGTGLPPGKAVVTNPYNVPLFQNAGALGAVR
jgi:hypothetical protein